MENKNETKLKCIICGKEINDIDKSTMILKNKESDESKCICSVCLQGIGYIANMINKDNQDIFDEDKIENKGEKIGKEIKRVSKLTPLYIKNNLDKFIIGQENAKKAMSIAIIDHARRVYYNSIKENSGTIEKNNILLIGPTGSGKTYLAKKIADQLGLPILIADATTLTQAGYVGKSVDSLIQELLEISNYDVSVAEKGIIFVDEVDKIASAVPGSMRGGIDISGKSVQQSMLKMMEGHKMFVDDQNNKMSSKKIEIDTKDILFIFSGAFVGLQNKEEKEEKGNQLFKEITLNKESSDDTKDIEPKKLIEYGFIDEFIGRIGSIVKLNKLTIDELKRIVLEPKDSIKEQTEKKLSFKKNQVIFEEKFVDSLATEANELDLGSRSLKFIMIRELNKIMFEDPENKKICFKDIGVVDILEKEETLNE